MSERKGCDGRAASQDPPGNQNSSFGRGGEGVGGGRPLAVSWECDRLGAQRFDQGYRSALKSGGQRA